jgi:fermentation-respiration switch protein FrsA (DUF1100 family)
MKKLKITVFILCISAIIGLSTTYFMQKKLIFLPSKLPQDYAYNFEEPFEELFLIAQDGAKLNAIHFKTQDPKGVILYFHGNAGDLSRWGEVTSYFTQFNYDVVVMDYRTYGKSTGKLTEKALFSDSQLFYDYVSKFFPENDIILYGRSLGTSIATYIASVNHPKKLILESPFYSMEDVAKSRFPIIPVKQLLKYKFATNKFIPKVHCQIVIFHGTDDDIVPYTSGKKLSELIADDQLEFISVPNGSHNNLIEFSTYKSGIEQALN